MNTEQRALAAYRRSANMANNQTGDVNPDDAEQDPWVHELLRVYGFLDIPPTPENLVARKQFAVMLRAVDPATRANPQFVSHVTSQFRAQIQQQQGMQMAAAYSSWSPSPTILVLGLTAGVAGAGAFGAGAYFGREIVLAPSLTVTFAVGILGGSWLWGVHYWHARRTWICNAIMPMTAVVTFVAGVGVLILDGFELNDLLVAFVPCLIAIAYVAFGRRPFEERWCPSCPDGLTGPANARMGSPAVCRACGYCWQDHVVVQVTKWHEVDAGTTTDGQRVWRRETYQEDAIRYLPRQ